MPFEIAGLYIYPIKSCGVTSLTEASVDIEGIAHDRRWMLVDEAGKFLTQREYAAMATIQPTVYGDRLVVSAPGGAADLVVSRRGDGRASRPATVWKFTGTAEDEGDEAAEWFSSHLGVACRLVRTGTVWDRPVNPHHALPDDRVGFADGYPVLLATEASLADLNAHLPTPLPMDRFRPNVVLRGEGLAAWAEDAWQSVCVPSTGARFRVAKACARCVMTTIDQATAEHAGPEPLTTLARLRRSEDGKVLFGVNLIPDGPGVLRVGDGVAVG